MRLITFCYATVLVILACVISSPSAQADVTPDQVKELRGLKREVTKVAGLMRKKEFEEATSALDRIEEQVKAIMEAAEVEENDRRLQGLPKLIETRRKALDLQMSKASGGGTTAKGVSFVDDVAPIIQSNCIDCHGMNNPRANLRLDAFAGWKRGGRSGRLLTPGAPQQSLLLRRLGAPNPQQRMPKDQAALSRDELITIAKWVGEGAKFDGDSEATPLGRLKKPAEMANIVIPKPKGTETVSFSKDIAPMMVRLCVRCHSGNTPSSGLSLATFEDIMVGGDSGEVIIPGDRENSRLFRLVGGIENPRMPQGQARLTRQNYNDLVKWFDEGNVFDGNDPKATLVSYVPTDQEVADARFSQMSADDFLAHRKEQVESLWKRTLPNDPFTTVESEQFIILGDVPEARLQQVKDWATAAVEALRKSSNDKTTSGAKAATLWKGKLGILVFKERFGMTEYALAVLNTQSADGIFGHSRVTPSHSQAYVVLQDMGDAPSAEQPGLKANLIDHLTGAYLQRRGDLPDWLVRGAGLVTASQDQPGNLYFKGLSKRALAAVGGVDRAGELFEDGTFSPTAIGPVGFTVVEYLIKASGKAKFSQFVERFQATGNLAGALQGVYGSSPDALGQAFLTALRRSTK